MVEVRSYRQVRNYADYKRLVKDEGGFFSVVHEHLVRERSGMLVNVIDGQKKKKKKKKKGEGKVVISIRAESDHVSRWIERLYGQPFVLALGRRGA